MPREWYDRHACYKIEDEEQREFYLRICADKKPYFMKYIYGNLSKDLNTYVRTANNNALRQFRLDVSGLQSLPEDERSETQKEFLFYYEQKMPVALQPCVMNRICWRFEREFDRYLSKKKKNSTFDYSILRSNCGYKPKQYKDIQALYETYTKRLKSYAAFANNENISDDEVFSFTTDLRAEFEAECAKICPDRRELCDIVVDLCYKKNTSKRFAWDMCGHEIIQNLLARHDNMIHYPTLSENGDIEYVGERFAVMAKVVSDTDEEDNDGTCDE